MTEKMFENLFNASGDSKHKDSLQYGVYRTGGWKNDLRGPSGECIKVGTIEEVLDYIKSQKQKVMSSEDKHTYGYKYSIKPIKENEMTIKEAKTIAIKAGYKLSEAKTRAQATKIQNHILSKFDGYDDLIKEIQHYYNDYAPGKPYLGRKAMAEQCFAAYMDDIKDFFKDLYSDQHYSPEQQAKFDHRFEIPSGIAQIEQQYYGLLQMELDNLYNNPTGGGKNYIAPKIKESSDYRRSGQVSDENMDGFASEADEEYYNVAHKGIDILDATVSQLYDILGDLNSSADISADTRISYLFDSITSFIEEKGKELEELVG
jgi:hypothetical protein